MLSSLVTKVAVTTSAGTLALAGLTASSVTANNAIAKLESDKTKDIVLAEVTNNKDNIIQHLSQQLEFYKAQNAMFAKPIELRIDCQKSVDNYETRDPKVISHDSSVKFKSINVSEYCTL